MEKNVYGYLIVTPNSKNTDLIAKDYWNSIYEMKKENTVKKTNYVCLVIFLHGNWWKRKQLSLKTGIPMKRIYSIKIDTEISNVMAGDSFIDDTYWGYTRVYDAQDNIAPNALACAWEPVFS